MNSTRAATILSVSLCLIPVVSVLAESKKTDLSSLSIEELMNVQIKTVSRIEEDLDKAPGSVYVITREQIRRRGYTSLRDALQVVPGFNVFHRDMENVAVVRGLSANDNEKFTLLVNGQELNQVNEPNLLDGPINLDNVERIEVVVGPSSIFLPANTLVATVNVITRKVDGTEVVASSGGERYHDVTVMAGESFDKDKSVSISATFEKRRGYDAWDRNFSVPPMNALAGRDVTEESTDEDHFIVARADLDDWSVQAVSLQKTFTEMRLEGANPGSDDKAIVNSIGVEHAHEFSSSWKSILKGSGAYKSNVRYASGVPWQSINQYDWNAEAGAVYSGIKGNIAQFGVQGLYEDNFDDTFQDVGQAPQIFYDRSTYGVGAYLDDTYQVSDAVKLVGGVRADRNTLVEPDWYPAGRAAVIYQPVSMWVTKLDYNSTVRMPSPLAALNEIWGKDVPGAPVWASGSPNAERPEKLSTLEYGNILYFKDTRASVNVYYQELQDFITWGSPHSNVGDYHGWGLEVSLDHRLSDRVLAWGNMAYVDSEFEPSASFNQASLVADAHQSIDPEGRLIGAPQYTANLGIDVDITKKVLFSTQARYFSKQPVELTPDGGTTFSFGEVDNQFYVDASLLVSDVVKDGVDFRLTGKNILDNQDPVGGPWLRGQYIPRGFVIEATLYWRF